MREVRWERMFPDELEAAFAERPLVYLSYGLCEPHGPQSALGMDEIRADAYCRRAAEIGGGIVAPPFYWNVHELGHYASWACRAIGEARPWLTALPPWMFFKSVWYHIRAADALGFHAAVLITGHGGPHRVDLPTFTSLVQPHVAMRLQFMQCGEVTAAPVGHAGAVETSLLWAVAPDCVDVSRMPASGLPEPRFAMGEDARDADRRTGERLVDGVAKALVARAQALLAAYAEPVGGRVPLTFDETEAIWREHLEPAIPGFQCMQPQLQGAEPPPQTSRWYRHWLVPARP